MKKLNKYIWIAKTSIQSNLAYFGDVASRFLFLAVILYIFLRLWQVTYSETGAEKLGDLTLAQMLWYLVITESIMLSGPRIAQAVDEDVRTGALAMQLIRPISYPLYRLSANLGERSVRFSMNLIVGGIIAVVLVGPIVPTANGLIVFVLSIPLAFVLDFLGNFLVGLGAFWLEDTSGILLIYSRVTMVLGGMLLPVELFPPWMQSLVNTLPFSAIVYGPARVFVRPDWSYLLALIVHQVLAILVFGTIIYAVFHLALRRVQANGG